MSNKLRILILTEILLLVISGCSTKWTKAIHSGKVSNNEFRETITIDTKKGLIFVPVTIHGKEYRFLFDSGAPFSISNQLQNDYDFKIISKGNILDSDHNRKKVKWAKVDSIDIGNITFLNQAAFIGDFDANPILKCLEIDGIIGSNLIRHCNWTIDQKQSSLSLYSTISEQTLKKDITIPFKTDYQYNIFIDVKISQAIIKNMLIDYGANSSISLSNEIFSLLKDKNSFGKIFLETGTKQSGIIGVPIDLDREITYSDSVGLDNICLKHVMIQTGNTTSIGNNLLSRFQVTIDWDKKNLYLKEVKKSIDKNSFIGFKLGKSSEKGIFVQSVVKQSMAYSRGVRPSMKVLKIDTLDFEKDNNFCDYVNHDFQNSIFIELLDSSGQKRAYHFEKTLYINDEKN